MRLEDPALEARFDAIQNMLMVQIVALAFVGGALLAQLVMRWFHAR